MQKQFNKHYVSALGGLSSITKRLNGTHLNVKNYAFNIDQISVGDANTQTNGGEEAEMGRACMDWPGKI